ncbi:hypothetical protein BHM03_00042726, partial [Ensete ventricosum]
MIWVVHTDPSVDHPPVAPKVEAACCCIIGKDGNVPKVEASMRSQRCRVKQGLRVTGRPMMEEQGEVAV